MSKNLEQARQTRLDKIFKIVKERKEKFSLEIAKKNYDRMTTFLKKRVEGGEIDLRDKELVILGADKINSQGTASFYKYIRSRPYLSGNAKWVFTTIVSDYTWPTEEYPKGKDYSFPSEEEIARKCGISERTVRNCLKELMGENKMNEIFLEVFNMGLNQGNLYILHFRNYAE